MSKQRGTSNDSSLSNDAMFGADEETPEELAGKIKAGIPGNEGTYNETTDLPSGVHEGAEIIKALGVQQDSIDQNHDETMTAVNGLAEAVGDLKGAEVENDELKVQITKLKASNAELEARAASETAEAEATIAELEARVASVEAGAEATIAELEARVASETARNEGQTEDDDYEYEDVLKRFEAEIELHEAKDALDKATAENNDNLLQLDRLLAENSDLREEIDSLRGEICRLRRNAA